MYKKRLGDAVKEERLRYRKLERQRSFFSSDTALVKALHPAVFETTKR